MTRFLLALALLTSLGACGDDDGGPSASAEDAGRLTWMAPDAGIPPRPDGGPPSADAGAVRVCYDIEPLSEAMLPRCRASTEDCVAACPMGESGNACRDACWRSDSTPPAGDIGCIDCVFRQLVSCIDTSGCHAEVAAWLCCIVDNCASSADPCCTERNCAELAQTMFVCGYTREPSCFDVTGGDIGQCYAESDPDAGVMDVDAGPAPDAGAPMDCSE